LVAAEGALELDDDFELDEELLDEDTELDIELDEEPPPEPGAAAQAAIINPKVINKPEIIMLFFITPPYVFNLETFIRAVPKTHFFKNLKKLSLTPLRGQVIPPYGPYLAAPKGLP
jgi:hypothetical protein